MRKFFVPPENIGEKSIIIDDSNDLHHLLRVLRMSEGDEICVSDTCEWEYTARIVSAESGCVTADITDKQRFSSEPRIRVTLFQGVPKQSKMELIVQKTVELGVDRIVPVFTARSVVSDNGRFAKKTARWQKISDEAVKQCRRSMIPEVVQAVKMKQVIEQLDDFDLVLFPYENEDNITIKDVLREEKDRLDSAVSPKAAVLIGPEGGFSDEEAAQITAAGGRSVSLGKTILRTETAGLAALSMIMYEMEL